MFRCYFSLVGCYRYPACVSYKHTGSSPQGGIRYPGTEVPGKLGELLSPEGTAPEDQCLILPTKYSTSDSTTLTTIEVARGK